MGTLPIFVLFSGRYIVYSDRMSENIGNIDVQLAFD